MPGNIKRALRLPTGTTASGTLKHVPVALPLAPSLAREGPDAVVPAGKSSWNRAGFSTSRTILQGQTAGPLPGALRRRDAAEGAYRDVFTASPGSGAVCPRHGPTLKDADLRLLAALQPGLPLSVRPYAEIGATLGLAEDEVIARIAALIETGVVRRFGIVVRHHEVGYGANAMVVWDVPDEQVSELGQCLAGFDFITLCYRRPRRLPEWCFNLYCMIHGKSREAVLANLEWMVNRCGLSSLHHEVLFSRRRFKQRGARYFKEGDDGRA